MTQVLREKLGYVFRHSHGLLFERFAHATKPTINGRADSNFWHLADKSIFRGDLICCHENTPLIIVTALT